MPQVALTEAIVSVMPAGCAIVVDVLEMQPFPVVTVTV
jgi:hypothetical protein